MGRGGDSGAGTATIIWIYPINYFLYAERNNMVLWIDFKNEFNAVCYDPKMGYENVWNYYLDPIDPESQGCDVNVSNITVLSYEYVYPFIHHVEPWAVRAWYYHWYHIQRKDVDYQKYYEAWFYRNRYDGWRIVQKYFRYHKDITDRVDEIWTKYFGDKSESSKYEIMGVHMRGTDKGTNRRRVEPEEYLEYMNKFLNYYGDRARFFIATDDANYLQFMHDNFTGIWYAQNEITRSDTRTPVFNLAGISKYEIGKQVITEILLLSRCDWFLHSASAVSESVFYNNIKLHNNSVHLEYIHDRQVHVWCSNSTHNL